MVVVTSRTISTIHMGKPLLIEHVMIVSVWVVDRGEFGVAELNQNHKRALRAPGGKVIDQIGIGCIPTVGPQLCRPALYCRDVDMTQISLNLG